MWKPYMKDLDTMFTDATCYESDMRYPTDQKLLWECVEDAYDLMCEASGKLGIHRPRTKFLDVEKANLTYRKQRKHTKSQTRKITRRLLELLGKILKEMRKMEREHPGKELFSVREMERISVITTVYRQQNNHFRSGDARESIPNRVVSVNKPYVRPIVRELCTSNGIHTSFVQKGKQAKEKREKDFEREDLARVRATTMEGSFGTQKEHYSMRRIKARMKKTEILYIFFGIHTANAVLLADRLEKKEPAKAA